MTSLPIIEEDIEWFIKTGEEIESANDHAGGDLLRGDRGLSESVELKVAACEIHGDLEDNDWHLKSRG
jgi:hypothetical protein